MLRVLLEQLAAGPDLAHLCLLDCYAAGTEATRQAEELPRFFTFFLAEGHTQCPATDRPPAITSEAVAGAIHHIIRQDVASGEAPSLPQRLPELAYIALAPFTGPSAASKTIERLSAT